ncbi:VOC family protein [uncultured Marivita sp.]|uniref:VOC family protein n=1 Tax=uncultured Marivita sp. TaxID=888080 RepID=UPI0026148953|nr:VOC family protein [uncultured Marivita sp.]
MSDRIANARLDHTSLMVRDLDAAAGFLVTVFGFLPAFGPVEIAAEFARMTGSEQVATRLMQLTDPASGQRIELISCANRTASLVADARLPSAHISFIVPDLATAMKCATQGGASSVGEITTFNEGRSAYIRAPGDLVVELEELFE